MGLVGNRWRITISYYGDLNNDSEQTNSSTKRQTATNQLSTMQKKTGQVNKEGRKRIRTEQGHQGEKKTTQRPNARTYPHCLHCQRNNFTADKSLISPNVASRSKRNKTENHNDSKDENCKPKTSTQHATTSILRIPLN